MLYTGSTFVTAYLRSSTPLRFRKGIYSTREQILSLESRSERFLYGMCNYSLNYKRVRVTVIYFSVSYFAVKSDKYKFNIGINKRFQRILLY